MADAEVAFTTDALGDSFCISVWDLGSGMQIKNYKGGNCSPHALSLLGNQYIMAAQVNKPIIHVWNVAKVSQGYKLIMIKSH
jgi:WD40 repeat protein